jgi:IS30 family transposase
MAKNKHLTLDDRVAIESSLTNSLSFKEIARLLGKDCSTISKEVRKHRAIKNTGAFGRPMNNCRLRYTCKNTYICHEPTSMLDIVDIANSVTMFAWILSKTVAPGF